MSALLLTDDALVYAFDIFADGRSKKLQAGDLAGDMDSGGAYRWIHINLAAPSVEPWIAGQTDEVVAESLTQQDTRPRCVRHEAGVLLNLRGVNLNPDADPEDMVSIRMWVAERLIISARLRRLLAVDAIRESMEKNQSPPSVATFLTELASGLTERMDGVISDLGDKVDDLEQESLEHRQGLRPQLMDLRRKTILLRRYISPQREALSALSAIGEGIIDADAKDILRETVDRVTRLVEELDAVRDRCAILNDQLIDQRAEEMNRHMMALSVVAAIFLPLGFLTGLLGVNIAGIPGAEAPWAFFTFCALLLGIGAGLYLWFRHRRWI